MTLLLIVWVVIVLTYNILWAVIDNKNWKSSYDLMDRKYFWLNLFQWLYTFSAFIALYYLIKINL